MKACISNKNKNVLLAIITLVLAWQTLSLFTSANALPSVTLIGKKVLEILFDMEMLENIKVTFLRLSLAMTISMLGGVLLGVLFATVFPFKEVAKEIFKILQVIPPISVLIMAIIWFGVNGKPAMFIVCFALIPLIALQVIYAIEAVDQKLLQMGKVFQLSTFDVVRYIYLPSIQSALWSALTVGLAIGVKILVMGEVLTTSIGIGGQITTARLNLEPETVLAWTIIMLSLYYLLEFMLMQVKKRTRAS